MDLVDDVENLIDINGGKTHGGLIHDDHLRLGHQCPAHGQHLLLTAGQCTCQLVLSLLQTGEMMVNHLDAFLDLRLVAAGEGTQHQVLINAQLCENPASLRHMRQSLLHQSMTGHMGDFLAVIENMS